MVIMEGIIQGNLSGMIVFLKKGFNLYGHDYMEGINVQEEEKMKDGEGEGWEDEREGGRREEKEEEEEEQEEQEEEEEEE